MWDWFSTQVIITNRQISGLCKSISNGQSATIKFSITLLSKIGKSGRFLGRLLGPLLKIGLSLIKDVLKPLTKSALIPLGLKAAASATDASIFQKKSLNPLWLRL